ncbi:hypothetical protein CYPRO_2994 [Cyclonatronum proteinivorum]|uniref:Uncharacterized protein n=1 Tax=Cyclonatronum proteinivorum TaxID=1457365 RepID=A0A345UP29_9BACT|nr:hypothetical protein [Cyclonatronum proteinivorum]AXJ02231.1 hypothetical protein CYPRO_2994 [Cyclonatronum proteinivorum]
MQTQQLLNRPIFFLEPALIFHLMDANAVIRLSPGSSEDTPKAEMLPEKTKAGESCASYDQDGIRIYVSEKLKLPPAAQVSIMLKKGWFSKSAEARIVPRQRATGFMGTKVST